MKIITFKNGMKLNSIQKLNKLKIKNIVSNNNGIYC